MTRLLLASNPLLLTVILIVVLVAAMEITYRSLRHNKVVEVDDKSWDTIRNGIITLVAFMLGLTFAQAQGRFDARRDLVVKEANSIGTVWLRADQLAPKETTEFRDVLIVYARDRIQAYSTPGQPALYVRVMDDSDRRQARMWSLASAAVRRNPTDQGKSLLMSSLNDTIDLSSEQVAALTHHVPTAVLVLTFVLVMLGSVTIGLQFARAKSRPIGLTILYAAAFAIVLNLIVDFDRPQSGFIHVPLDPLQIQLRAMEK